MFTEIRKRGRGRPRGTTDQGAATRRRLFATAIKLLAARGYAATTLREIAKKANVSAGLLYRYFPSKRAVVLALYDDLSVRYATQAAQMPRGPWRDRFLFALKTSLAVLAAQRPALAALTPILVGDPGEGVLAAATSLSRQRVQAVFQQAVLGASDAPKPEDAAALGRLLYVIHLAVILWWLLDQSPTQRATWALIATLTRALPIASVALRLNPARSLVLSLDVLCREALLGSHDSSVVEKS